MHRFIVGVMDTKKHEEELFGKIRQYLLEMKEKQAVQSAKLFIGGSKGGARDARTPWGPNSFICMQFVTKN